MFPVDRSRHSPPVSSIAPRRPTPRITLPPRAPLNLQNHHHRLHISQRELDLFAQRRHDEMLRERLERPLEKAIGGDGAPIINDDPLQSSPLTASGNGTISDGGVVEELDEFGLSPRAWSELIRHQPKQPKLSAPRRKRAHRPKPPRAGIIAKSTGPNSGPKRRRRVQTSSRSHAIHIANSASETPASVPSNTTNGPPDAENAEVRPTTIVKRELFGEASEEVAAPLTTSSQEQAASRQVDCQPSALVKREMGFGVGEGVGGVVEERRQSVKKPKRKKLRPKLVDLTAQLPDDVSSTTATTTASRNQEQHPSSLHQAEISLSSLNQEDKHKLEAFWALCWEERRLESQLRSQQEVISGLLDQLKGEKSKRKEIVNLIEQLKVRKEELFTSVSDPSHQIGP